VVFLMAIESACIPFPSEVIMPLAGWILVKDRGHGLEYLFLAAFFGALGNTLGSVIAYYAGAAGGRPLLEKYGKYVLITPRELDWADHWFGRYGQITVFATRLMPVVRTFISVPAGVARMPFWRFTLLTFAGSYPWSLALAFGGYQLGEHYDRLSTYFRPVTIPIAILVIVTVAYLIYRRIREISRAGSIEALVEAQREQREATAAATGFRSDDAE
jgi:membrane protein DedA with SNARE-associated domain